MVGRESKALGIAAEVGQAERLGVGDEKAENPLSGGTGPYSGLFVRIQPDRDELGQGGAAIIEHSERPIAGSGHGTGLFDHVAEEYRQLEIPFNEQGCLENPPEFCRILDGAIRHKPVRYQGESPRHGKNHSCVVTVIVRPNEIGTAAPVRWEDGGMTLGVFLLDDHEVVRSGLRGLLEAGGDIKVVGEAGTVAEAMARIPPTRPNVAVLDVRLPDGSGIEVCREIRSRWPEIACLMLTSYADDEALFAAIMAGAAGYLLKRVGSTDLVDAVDGPAKGSHSSIRISPSVSSIGFAPALTRIADWRA